VGKLAGDVGLGRCSWDIDFFGQGLAAAAFALEREGGVLGGGIEQRGEVGGKGEVRSEFTGEIDEDFLHGIVGVGFVAGETPGEAIDPVAVAEVESVERGPVPALTAATS
jgi:hypothetical protein